MKINNILTRYLFECALVQSQLYIDSTKNSNTYDIHIFNLVTHCILYLCYNPLIRSDFGERVRSKDY